MRYGDVLYASEEEAAIAAAAWNTLGTGEIAVAALHPDRAVAAPRSMRARGVAGAG